MISDLASGLGRVSDDVISITQYLQVSREPPIGRASQDRERRREWLSFESELHARGLNQWGGSFIQQVGYLPRLAACRLSQNHPALRSRTCVKRLNRCHGGVGFVDRVWNRVLKWPQMTFRVCTSNLTPDSINDLKSNFIKDSASCDIAVPITVHDEYHDLFWAIREKNVSISIMAH